MIELNEKKFYNLSLEEKCECIEQMLALFVKDKKHNVELISFVSYKSLGIVKGLTADNINNILIAAENFYNEIRKDMNDSGCSLHSLN